MERSEKLFTTGKKLNFYFKYFYLRTIFIWFEVKTPKFKYFLFEILYALSKLIPSIKNLPYTISISRVTTKFGEYVLRPGTMDSVCASPVFERGDIDHFLELVKKELEAGKKVLFLDIGADFGSYSITLANHFPDTKNLSIIAYEPAPENRKLLNKNLTLNGLKKRVEVVPYALGSHNTTLKLDFRVDIAASSSLVAKKEGESLNHQIAVKVKTFDSLSSGKLKGVNTVVAKIDVEGYESEVLAGAKTLFDRKRTVHLMVEDFVDDTVIATLKTKKTKFREKVTPYNSWWEI